MGRRKHIGSAQRLLGIGEHTRAHRNFLDTRGCLRTVKLVSDSGKVRSRTAARDFSLFYVVERALIRAIRLALTGR
jgi:hypothetical protein